MKGIQEMWAVEKARWEDDLWRAQLEFWPNSVRLSLNDMYNWCAEGSLAVRSMRWSALALALQYPTVVFYRTNSDPAAPMGFRFGIYGADYASGLSSMKE